MESMSDSMERRTIKHTSAGLSDSMEEEDGHGRHQAVTILPLLAGNNNDGAEYFQASGTGSSNCVSYTAALAASPATMSADELELLNTTAMLNTLDHEMMLSDLGAGSSSAAGIRCDDEFPQHVLEHPERWSSASEPNAMTWKASDYPSAEHNSFFHQDRVSSPCGSMENNRLKPKYSQFKTRKSDVGKQKAEVSKGHYAGNSTATRTKSFDSSDDSDAMEDDEGSKTSLNGKTPSSKNLVSERRRRKKLNERLYSLRALVPKISKMDKASIVSDAISYVQDLQKEVDDLQVDIAMLQSRTEGGSVELPDSTSNGIASVGFVVPRKHVAEHQILELEVTEMEEQTYHLRLHCKKGPGVFVQLSQALESLDLEIVNANLTSVSDHILNTIVVKVKNREGFKTEELRRLTLEAAPKFGLYL